MRNKSSETLKLDSIRLDKWLWAARFFKTRQLAVTALKTGKVLLNKQRSKPANNVKLGDELVIKRGIYEQTVVVLELSERRVSATIAAQFYEETKESIDKQQVLKQQLANQPKFTPSEHKPDKRDIRLSREIKRRDE